MNLLEFVILAILGLYAVDALPKCEDENFDVDKVTRALMSGLSKETLLMHLGPGTGLGAERVERIHGLIDDAYLLTPQQAREWWAAHHRECAKEDEA